MATRAFLQVDVFTARPYYGNPVAVILDADGLDPAAMQRIANWTNLSETTFLLPPTTPAADYRVRIFTPARELPFAGHPSVGSAYAAIAGGKVDAGKRALVQECPAGLLPMRVDGEGAQRTVHIRAPQVKFMPADPTLLEPAAAALGARPRNAPQNTWAGPWWLLCDLGEAAAVRGLKPDLEQVAALSRRAGAIGISVFGRERGGEADYAVRAFCPGDGIAEDPVTGSANAAIGAWLRANDPAAAQGLRFRASQGRELGRDGLVEVSVDAAGEVEIGGRCVICVEGRVSA